MTRPFQPQRRRTVATLAAVPAAFALAPAFAADTWPTRSLLLIASSAPGGTTDLSARMLSDPLAKALGQAVVVENRAGANGVLAAVAVKRAEPDGYTLLMQYSGYHVITPNVQTTPAQWQPSDFQPIANVLSAPQIVVVREGLPVRTMADLVAYAKAHPGQLSYASSGLGSLQHATGAMLEQQAGIKMTHVPYKGTGPALNDLLGAQVDLTFGTPPPFIPHIAAGKLRALATTGTKRLASLPDVPTTAEAGLPKLNPTSWFAVYAPARTPKAVVDRLTEEIRKITADADFRAKATSLGADADYMEPARLAAFGASELHRWAEVVKAADIKGE